VFAITVRKDFTYTDGSALKARVVMRGWCVCVCGNHEAYI